MRLRDLSGRDLGFVMVGESVGGLLYGYFKALFALASSIMAGVKVDAVQLLMRFAEPTLFWGVLGAFWWKRVTALGTDNRWMDEWM
mmetsp:Transcript_26778/g.76814  ORF Transcript_26778/g.76814 Transcript_26778/m.76814 type:complete len:86 (+) Transcript_26778:68-325(+)